MNKTDITEFRESLANFTLDELKAAAIGLQESISKMILDSDIIVKAAIVDTLIKEKEEELEKESKDGQA